MERLIKSHSKAKQYAVYAHYYKDQLFYIGSGIYHRDNTSRSRAYDFISRSPDWFDYCDGETEKIEVKILFTTNDRKLAFDKEEEITKTYIEKGYKLINKNLGIRPSAETKIKMSLAKKGRKHSVETKIKMSLARKGKMSGKDHPMYGKNHSEETRKKISDAKKGKMSGKDHPMYGKNHSEETRKRMSLAKKGGNHPKAKRVLIVNNENGETKVFDSIKDAHEFISKNRFDKTKNTLQNYLKKGPFSFKNYTMEVTKDVAS